MEEVTEALVEELVVQMVDLVVEVVEEIEMLEPDLEEQVIHLQLVPHKDQMAEDQNVKVVQV